MIGFEQAKIRDIGDSPVWCQLDFVRLVTDANGCLARRIVGREEHYLAGSFLNDGDRLPMQSKRQEPDYQDEDYSHGRVISRKVRPKAMHNVRKISGLALP